MRPLVLTGAAFAVIGFTTPFIPSAQAEKGKVVVSSGERGEHHRDRNRNHRKAVAIKRDHDRGYHGGWRNHRAEGDRVIIPSEQREADSKSGALYYLVE